MVAPIHKHHKAVANAVGGDGASLTSSGNRISAYADDVYAGIASEMNAMRNGQGGPINRITQTLNPTASEEAVMAARRQQAQQMTNQAVAEVEQETAGTRRMDTAIGYADTAMQVAGFAPMIVGGAQMLTKGASWAGNKVGTLTGLKSATSVADAAKAAKEVRSWNEITFNEIGHATGTKGLVGGIAQGGANIVASPIHWVAEKTGLSKWRAGANATHAENYLTAAKDAARELTHDDISILGGLRSKVSTASSATHFAAGETQGLIDAARKAEMAGGKQLSAAGSKFITAAEDSLMHGQNAKSWGDVRSAVKRAPGEMGKGSATHGLMNTAFIGMSALSMFGDARGFSQNLASLKQMYADITGEDVKNVSTLKVLTGDVPEPVAAARSHLVKTFGIKQAFDIGNIALNVAMMVNPKFSSGWKGMAAMIGTQMASTAVDGYMGESILPIHKAFSDAYKTGQQIPPDFYAAYIYAASKELRSRGDKGQEFAAAVAQQYAAERASPGQLLTEIQNGKLVERIQNISVKADQAPAQAAPQPVAQEQQMSAVARLNGERNEQQRPVVGKFTNKLQQESQMPAVGQGLA